MAGIGFELRKLLRKDSYSGLLQAYVYAGVISAGPWILSIIGIQLINIFSIGVVKPHSLIVQFQVSVTYVMATSLILSGLVQLAFTRFIADRLFEQKDDWVLPNFNGLLLATVVISGLAGLAAIVLLFEQESVLYRLLLLAAFVIMCATWLAAVLLSGLKKYKEIVALFFVGYTVVVATALLLRPYGLEGLMAGFVSGQFLLLVGMMTLIYRSFPSDRGIGFDLFRPGAMFSSLMLTGLFYNAAIWADKFIFWFTPETSQQIIGPLRASAIYDLPIFLAYLATIPGMAVFLIRIETDFVEYYDKFYDGVREGVPLATLERTRNNLVRSVRQGLFDIAKVQAITVLIIFALGDQLLLRLGISPLYLPLLSVDVVATSLQVILVGILNILFYLDKRRMVTILTGLFLVSNTLLSWISIKLGAFFFGYGLAISLLLTVLVGLWWLGRRLDALEYETFMLQ
ncbi:MAG: exopolysaccharide Pel transporter PelG [Aggregatilineaceae bacterium]